MGVVVSNRRRLPNADVAVPAKGPQVPCLHLSLAAGEHPALAQPFAALHTLPLDADESLYTLGLPLAPCTNGHHLLEDEGYLTAAGEADIWPFAPAFVRDLAGRILHTGLNPLPTVPEIPLVPATCRWLPPATPGLELLEKTFFTAFRRLEWNPAPHTRLTGRADTTLRAVYDAPHAYPYKLRVDSFYQDGFRLPQLERLYVHPAPDDAVAARAGADLLSRWKSRPQGQTYQQFYEANEGDAWFEELFRQGCTVIPTFEAYNGYFKVTSDYGMADVWPGCVVEGLHAVVDYRADASPAGTILEVLQPGYALEGGIVPAQVIASDGSGYVSPLGATPAPLRPDPALPHPRMAAGADVWLPTHPTHFENPALWDWNGQGHFQQVYGPLWDPLHYTYTSTAKILAAFRHAFDENPALAAVPAEMQPRFHPVCALTSYDTPNATTQTFRATQAQPTPFRASALDRTPMLRTVAEIGYHPLPEALEYELDAFVFPQLSPRHLAETSADNPAPVITSNVTVAEAQKLAVFATEPAREAFLDAAFHPHPFTYPQLARYRLATPPPEPPARISFCYLPNLPTSELMINVKRFFAGKAHRQQLDALDEALFDQFYTFREQALAWRRLRHRLARKYAGWYLALWWQQHTPQGIDDKLQTDPDQGLISAEMLLHGQPGAGKGG
ncbi:MAG: hypothetical protein H6922_05750 [Pseudomonadaceae bacterium]|nr:hypothetical protein [Pseudomonadaceae bacterium]